MRRGWGFALLVVASMLSLDAGALCGGVYTADLPPCAKLHVVFSQSFLPRPAAACADRHGPSTTRMKTRTQGMLLIFAVLVMHV